MWQGITSCQRCSYILQRCKAYLHLCRPENQFSKLIFQEHGKSTSAFNHPMLEFSKTRQSLYIKKEMEDFQISHGCDIHQKSLSFNCFDENREDFLSRVEDFFIDIGIYNFESIMYDLPLAVREAVSFDDGESSKSLVNTGDNVITKFLNAMNASSSTSPICVEKGWSYPRKFLSRFNGHRPLNSRIRPHRLPKNHTNSVDSSRNHSVQMETKDVHVEASVLNSQLLLSVKGNSDVLQRRTVKTTPQIDLKSLSAAVEAEHSGTVAKQSIESSEALKEVKLTDVKNERFRSNETRLLTASIDDMKRLTEIGDINGIRRLITKYKWPSYRLLKSILPELFNVFIAGAQDVAEIKNLVQDFAVSNARAFLPNVVVLSLLTRIIREEGVKAATVYARQHRSLFLVKPPLDNHFSTYTTAVAENLFIVALAQEQNRLVEIEKLCQTLIELGYIHNGSTYLYPVLKTRLQSDSYETAYQIWVSNAKKCRVGIGANLLIKATIQNSNVGVNIKKERLHSILQRYEEFSSIFDGMAEIIVELVKADMIRDAQCLLIRLKISGHHFLEPLIRMKDDEECLAHVESFASLLTVMCSKSSERYQKNRCSADLQEKELAPMGYIKSILESWQPRRRNRSIKSKRKYKANPESMQKLIHTLQSIWFNEALKDGNADSLTRLFAWSAKFNFELSDAMKKRYSIFLSGKSNQCVGDN